MNGQIGTFDKLAQAVITPPPEINNSHYAALPSISYNVSLKKFVCVFETNVGFCLTKSDDGIQWEKAKLIFAFPQPQSERKKGDTWYSYPSLLSDSSQPSDGTTDSSRTLVCSKGKWLDGPHQMSLIPFHF